MEIMLKLLIKFGFLLFIAAGIRLKSYRNMKGEHNGRKCKRSNYENGRGGC